MSFYTGGLHNLVTSPQAGRADVRFNNVDIEADLKVSGDIDILGSVCVTDGVKDNVCLTTNGIIIDPNTNTSNTLQVFKSDGITNVLSVDTSLNTVNMTQLGVTSHANIGTIKIDETNNQIDNTASGAALTIHADAALNLEADSSIVFRTGVGQGVVCQMDESSLIVDATSATAFVVRDDGGVNTILTVNTTSPQVLISSDNGNALNIDNKVGVDLFNVNCAANRVTVIGSSNRALKVTDSASDNQVIQFDTKDDAEIRIESTMNDVAIRFRNIETANTTWTLGSDISAGSDGARPFVISAASSLGSNNAISIDEATQQVNIAQGITLLTTGGSKSALDYYERSYILTQNYTGAVTISNVDHFFTRVGNMVTVTIAEASGTSGSAAGLIGASLIAVRYRPFAGIWATIPVRVGGVTRVGSCQITSGGTITIGNSDSSGVLSVAFPASGTVGWEEFSISWIIY
uniref:Uncharacterized protein n=1 Tax=Pithovirus LCPAC001 TaxID=2506585 RepID=A0A481Z2Y6_9VIRU|nr:MAG: hypothetical protein LCPAC001_02260 [Pithovirus LCPAC001]